jgi:hypothetical protein
MRDTKTATHRSGVPYWINSILLNTFPPRPARSFAPFSVNATWTVTFLA